MKRLFSLAVLMAAAMPSFAADSPQIAVGQDPLTRQILRSAARPNGGVASYTSVQGADGKRVTIALVDPNAGSAALGGASAGGDGSAAALGSLAPAGELAPRKISPAQAETSGRVKTPAKQLKRIDDRKSW